MIWDGRGRSRQALNYQIQYFSPHWLDNWGILVGAWRLRAVRREGGSWDYWNVNNKKPHSQSGNKIIPPRRTLTGSDTGKIFHWKLLLVLGASHVIPAKFNSTGLPLRSPSGFSTSISFGLGRLNLNFLTLKRKYWKDKMLNKTLQMTDNKRWTKGFLI